MLSFLGQLTTLLIVAVLGVVLLAGLGIIKIPRHVSGSKGRGGKRSGDTEVFNFDGGNATDAHRAKKSFETEYISFNKLNLMDNSGRVLETYDIVSIPEKPNGLMVGRGNDCQINIPESCKTVGTRHAAISKDDKGIFIVDMDSRNGMYNNKKERKQTIDLSNGTQFYLGKTLLEFVEVDPFDEVGDTPAMNASGNNDTKVSPKIRRI